MTKQARFMFIVHLEHEVKGELLSLVNFRRAASTTALKAYSSYTPGPTDSKLGRKNWDDL